MFGDALAGNVERGAVIDGRSDKRKSQGDVDGFAKRKTLDRNPGLVMIARDHGVELAARGAQKNRVSRKRAAHVDAVSEVATLDCGQNFGRFLNPEQSAFG